MASKASKTKYTSKGERPNVTRSVLNALRSEDRASKRAANVRKAWLSNKSDPWVTVANSNPNETRERFIRVRAKTLWGDPRGVRTTEKKDM